MSLGRYAAIRLLFGIPVIIGILAVTFVITHVLPTNPAVLIAGEGATDETIAAIEHRLGLDKSMWAQFWDYLTGVFHGDLGRSILSNGSILDEIAHRLPSTLELISLAIPLAGLIGIGLAILSADRRGPRDYTARAVGTIGTAVPDYLFGLGFIMLFFAALKIAPAPLGQQGGNAPDIPRPTGAYALDAIIAGNWEAFRVGLAHLVLPVMALSLHFAAPIYRVARASLEDALRGPYVDYAIMMGGRKRYVWRAVVENSLPPVLTISGIIYGLLLGGAILVETVFGWGGLGQYGLSAVLQNDYNAIQGFVLVAAIFSVLVYLSVDLLHAALDPRVRRGLTH